MSYCLNPYCQKPNNPKDNQFCINCGTKLLLKDRYRGIKAIGQGGFGRTFLAIDEDKPSKPACVIKQLFPQISNPPSNFDNNTILDKAAALFEQEAMRLDELGKHPQIPDLLAYFIQDNYQYLIQEFINGQNLAEILKTEGVFQEKQIRDLLNSILPILDFIHTRQVIHRDIKPENIIYRQDGKIFLVDFGAAKFVTGTALIKTGTSIGTPEYIAPEQIRGKAIFASDLYSLGVTCLYLLTQVSPFELFDIGENKWVWRDYLNKNNITQELGRILDKLIENAVNKRYHSASEVLQDLLTSNQENNKKSTTSDDNSNKENSKKLPQHWRLINTLKGHSDFFAGICAIAISPSGKIIASASEDCTIKLWNLKTGKEIYTLTGHLSFVRTVAFSANKQFLVSGSDDGVIKIWKLRTKQEIYSILAHPGGTNSVAISPESDIIASGGDDKKIKLWDIKTGKEIGVIAGKSGTFKSVAFSGDGKYLISGIEFDVKMWDIKTCKEIRIFAGHLGIVNSVVFSPNGRIIASSDNGNEIRLWNWFTGKLIRTLIGHSGWLHNGVNSVAISPDGKLIASGGGDKNIKIWNIRNGELLCTLSGHTKGVTSVAFSMDGKTLVSGSMDKHIKIWQQVI